MAIVEDEVRNECVSEEENEIEVVVEDDAEDHDSGDDDSDDDGSEEDDSVEAKIEELERNIAEDPSNVNNHLELIKILWSLSDFDRYRVAFDRLRVHAIIPASGWESRLRMEEPLGQNEMLATLFQQATLDCFSLHIHTEWCSWALNLTDKEEARKQLDEVLKRAGADPFTGKLFWDAKADFERTLLQQLNETDEKYNEQLKRVMYTVEEIVSRPLLHGEKAWAEFEELAAKVKDQEYIDKVKQQHEAAQEFLQEITPFEDRLLTIDCVEEKLHAYQDYIEKVKDLAREDKYVECDADGVVKVVYERATYECMSSSGMRSLVLGLSRWCRRRASRSAYRRALQLACRRAPRYATPFVLEMRRIERDDEDLDKIKLVLEQALTGSLESYAEAEAVWMAYMEYVRRTTPAGDLTAATRLRRTARLAWETLLQTWGEAATDCAVPLFWARLEYSLLEDHKAGKELFEEMFKCGDNKSKSKYWELLIRLETSRNPAPSPNKLRDLHRRAVKFVTDYPPSVCMMWVDRERDTGTLGALEDATEVCEDKLKEWRHNYEAQKRRLYEAQRQKGKMHQNKKGKMDSKGKKGKEQQGGSKGKRKMEEDVAQEGENKKKKENELEGEHKSGSGKNLKRQHQEEAPEVAGKKARTDGDEAPGGDTRDACTLFVSNLAFKVEESSLREKLSEWGEIVSLRVRSGVKAFGGSICYCQYATAASVERALSHDRAPLDGRPMFLSRYTAGGRDGPHFRYSTGEERHKLFVRNLPFTQCTQPQLREVFEPYGEVKDIRVVTHRDGKPKGLAYVEFATEDAARDALQATRGMELEGRALQVDYSAPPPRAGAAPTARSAATPATGMRRTQLSSFIPSVLQRPSTSKAPQPNGESASTSGSSQPKVEEGSEDSRPLSNKDFRDLLLNKK